jgi:chromosome segregation ATPase
MYMSEEKINLEWLGDRVMTMSAELRDMQSRFRALEARFGTLESRFTAMEARLGGIESHLGTIDIRIDGLEERQSRMLTLLVRIAERLDGPEGRPRLY